ncbi:MAG: MarR family transcriptional regulator [Acidobacteriota bacterium]|nr:MarR family transcriptional regulator [Acidobacteriota bacterium]
MSEVRDDTTTAVRLRLALVRLTRALRQGNTAGLSPSQLSALSTIDDFGPLRVSAVAVHESVGAPVATRVVASLEELGLVTRESDPVDKRATLVALSAHGQTTIDQLWTQRTRGLSSRLERLSDEERRSLEEALPALEKMAREL